MWRVARIVEHEAATHLGSGLWRYHTAQDELNDVSHGALIAESDLRPP